MSEPEPLRLARQLAPHLAGLHWGIGGSTLLHQLGLEAAPRDLDIVTTEADFAQVIDRLGHSAPWLGVATRPDHAEYASACFARFANQGAVGGHAGAAVDVMAGIAVRRGEHVLRFAFRPDTLRWEDGLPWMSACDWALLYQWFGRPEREAALRRYLAA